MDCAVHWTVSLCWKVRLSVILSGHKSFSRASAWVMRPSHFTLGQSEAFGLPNRAGPQQGFSHIRARNVQPVSVYDTQRARYPEESTWNDRKRDKLPYLEKTGLCVCVSDGWMRFCSFHKTTEEFPHVLVQGFSIIYISQKPKYDARDPILTFKLYVFHV